MKANLYFQFLINYSIIVGGARGSSKPTNKRKVHSNKIVIIVQVLTIEPVIKYMSTKKSVRRLLKQRTLIAAP